MKTRGRMSFMRRASSGRLAGAPGPARRRTCVWQARWLAVLLAAGTALAPLFDLRAQVDPPDSIAFKAAAAAMEDRQFDRAAGEFAEFIKRFPESPLKQEASERSVLARAEAQAQRNEHAQAAETFASFLKSFPSSPRAVLAALGEATARLRLGDAPKATLALTEPNGAFQHALAMKAPPEALFGGLLVLAESRAATKNPDAAVEALELSLPFARNTADQWRRQRLLVSILGGAGRTDAAIAAAEKLQELSRNDALKAQRPEANATLGEWLERGGKLDRARQAWEANLALDVPLDARQRAAIKVADLLEVTGNLPAARQRLEEFARTAGTDGGGPRVRLKLGQFLFRQYLAARGTRTNNIPPETSALLTEATAHFDLAATNTSDSAVAPLAQLGRGWCLWEQNFLGPGTNRMAESGEAFRLAAEGLPRSPDQAVARFKFADCLLAQKLPALALTNYIWVSERYTDLPSVQAELAEPALLQAALVATDLGQLEAAGKAVERLLSLDNAGEEVQRSVLLAGQALARAGGGARARELFIRFSERFPSAALRADAQLALAASWIREERWTNAMGVLAPWVKTYGTNHPAAPRAEFDLAWSEEQAGLATNSVGTFLNLVTKYPTHPFAQTGLLLLGDRFSEKGDFARAEQIYITIFTNTAWNGTFAQHQARLGAARAALDRRSPPTARERLNAMINDPGCPTNLLAEAFFVLGMAWHEDVPESRTNLLENFKQAIAAFSKVEKYDLTHERVPQAWCLIGDCALRIAGVETNRYVQARDYYLKAVKSAAADIDTRSRASIGLARVARKTEQSDVALGHYQDVLYGKLRRPGEDLSAPYVKIAGTEAADLLVEKGRRAEAARVYERLAEILPTLKPLLEKRIAELRETAAAP